MASLPPHSRWLAAILALLAIGIGISSFQAEDDSYTYNREESVLQLSLVAIDGTDMEAVGGSATVEVVTEFHSWEIWSDPSTGEEEYRNATAIPASGVTVELLLPNGNGSISNASPITDSEGRVAVVYTPQEIGTADLEARTGESFASLTFSVGISSGAPESWNYSHTEATLVGVLATTDGRTELAEGETSSLSLTVHYETWDVMMSDSGNTRIENHTSAPAEGAAVEWVSESGDGTVSGYSVTDSAGFALGSLTMGSSSTNVRVDISYATGQSTSASLECFVISGAYYDPYSDPSYSDPSSYDPTTDPSSYDSMSDPSYYDPATDPSYGDPSSDPSYDPAYDWSWSRTETVFSIVNLAADGPTSLAAGDTRTITGQLMEESWDVWVNSGSEDYRFNYSGPAAWSNLRIEPAGGGASVANSTPTTDGDGWFSAAFTMGADSTVVDFFQGDATDSIASVEFLLDDASSSGGTPTPEWTFIQTEGTYIVDNLAISGPTYDLLPGDSRTVTGTLSWGEWEVWIDGSGNTETRNGSSSPVSPGGFDVVAEQGDGLVTPQSLSIGEEGIFSVTFTMGSEASRIAFSVDGSSQTLSPVDFTPPPPPEPFGTFSRIEQSLSLAMSPDAAVELLQAGATVPLRADVVQTSWEVWEDGLGNTELRNHSTGPAIGVNVQFSLLTGPGSFALTDATTDAGGVASTAFTLGESDSDIAATVQFEGVSADARLTLAPEPWEYLQTDESLTVSLAGAGDPPVAVAAMVLHHRADVWQHRDSGATEVRSESSSPAENAVVAFAPVGSTSATFGATTVTTDEFGRAMTPYHSDEPVIVSAVARFAGLTATVFSSLPAGSGDTGGSGNPNPGDGGSNPGDGDGNPGDGGSNPGDGGSPGDGPGNPANPGEGGEFPAVALKGRVHRTEGGRGGTDDTPGSEIETYEELVHFEVDLIRPVFGFEGEEEEPERQTLSGNSSEEYGQMREQWETEGWEIENLGEGVENPRTEYEEVEIQNPGSEGEYGNPYGSPLEVRGLRSGSGHDIVLIETLAEEDEIRQLYEQIEETPEDRYKIYWNGSIEDMGFTTEQWSSGERILFGEDPYHPAPVMRSSAHFTTDTGVSPTVSWSEYWFQAEKEIPEGKSATKTFLIHATQLERNSDPDAPPLTAEEVEANREEWFGTVTFKIKAEEKISTEAPEVEWNGSPPCANWVEAKSDGTLLVKPPANRNDQEGEENVVVLLPVEVKVDYDRDGKIDDQDKGKVTEDNPWRWWVNDDDDQRGPRGGKENGWDQPGSESPDAVASPEVVDGIRDLIDFFPLHIDIGSIMEVLPHGDYFYRIAHEESAFNFFEAKDIIPDGDPETDGPGSLLRDHTAAANYVPVGNFLNPIVRRADESGAELTADFLQTLKDNGTGVLLLEARAETEEPLLLKIENSSGAEVASFEFPVEIAEVEDMYRHVNLRPLTDGSGGNTTSTSEPLGYPDDLTNDEYLVYIHGFNVGADSARGSQSNLFKRFHQLGSKARFIGLSWHGNPPNPGINWRLPPDYHRAAYNGLTTGMHLADALSFARGSELTVLAHSLGNSVAGNAIANYGLSVDHYYIVNGAIAMEAYDPDQVTNSDGDEMARNMTEDDWKPYYDLDDGEQQRLLSSNWHELFPDDSRGQLTWRGLFAKPSLLSNAHNFYSPGDEVVENPDETEEFGHLVNLWSNAGKGGRHAWVAQEISKGGQHPIAGAGFHDLNGGWEFNYVHAGRTSSSQPDSSVEASYVKWEPVDPNLEMTRKYSPEEARDEITDSMLKTKPFHLRFLYTNLYDPTTGATVAADVDKRNRLLGSGLPASSYAIAANSLDGLDSAGRNYNMQDFFQSDRSAWPEHSNTRAPENWAHSDFKDVAIQHVYLLYEEMIAIADLAK